MSSLSRREFLRTALATGAVASVGGPLAGAARKAARAKPAGKPNIVFIFGDDWGLDNTGCYGSDRHKDRTPQIDALAAGGIRFERCYSTPLCGPTRCQINTGRYPFHTGGLTNQTAGQPLSKDEYPLARILTEAGYDTCHLGKWRQVGETPGDWGFGEYITDPTAGGWYWQKSYTKNGQLIETPEEIYYPDVCHEYALEFLRRHAASGSASGQPFYLYYASHFVHGPILRTPDSKPGETDPVALYNDNIAYLDKQVGSLVAELDKLGLRENTMIVFSTDNGTVGQPNSIGGRTINGVKGTMLEGGSRVPFLVNWKGVAPAGRVLKDLVDFSDLLPTFVEVAGAKLPASRKYDGRSFAPQIRGRKGTPREWIFVQLGSRWYVRDDGWKLNQAGELFDMKDSPFVEQLVPADTKDQAAVAARRRLQAVLDQLNPRGGKTISPEAEEAAKKRQKTAQQKQGQKQGKKQGKKKKAAQP
ncbi:MAG: sulfatase-like hydrolase/transferase [Planctomycetes bacterium]|jgi:arylsulfatase A|nr:sulfatase-like hydrolase/transferase [Planctomycetota bacterium]